MPLPVSPRQPSRPPRRGCHSLQDHTGPVTTTETTSDDLRYPVGRFAYDGDRTSAARNARIGVLDALATQLVAAVRALTPEQLDTPYRPDGWTVRQVIHHLADGHMHGYARFKLALTEPSPTIRPYDEALWAQLSDVRDVPVLTSLGLLDALHARWVGLLRGMSDADWERGYVHPEQGRLIPLDEALAIYAWHSQHHLAHITRLRERMGWNSDAPTHSVKKRAKGHTPFGWWSAEWGGLYPVTIVRARYGGTYEGGAWLAFPCDPEKVPLEVSGSDTMCGQFFTTSDAEFIGRGATADEALADLVRRLQLE